MRTLFRRGWMAVIPVATALAVVGGVLGVASTNVHLVSTTDPYSGCQIGGPGFVSVSAEVEPFVAVNPKRGSNLVGVFQQDRWYDGGAHGLAAGVSLDGGQSWKVVPLPFSSCATDGMPYQRASDAWVSFGPDGKAYANALQFDETTPRNAVSAGFMDKSALHPTRAGTPQGGVASPVLANMVLDGLLARPDQGVSQPLRSPVEGVLPGAAPTPSPRRLLRQAASGPTTFIQCAESRPRRKGRIERLEPDVGKLTRPV